MICLAASAMKAPTGTTATSWSIVATVWARRWISRKLSTSTPSSASGASSGGSSRGKEGSPRKRPETPFDFVMYSSLSSGSCFRVKLAVVQK